MFLDWSALIIVGAATLIYYLIPFAMLFIIPSNRKPSSATAWLMLVFSQPIVGLIVFLYLGSPKLPRYRRKMQATMTGYIQDVVKLALTFPEYTSYMTPALPTGYTSLAQLATNLGGMPPFGQNKVTLLPEYNAVFKVLAAAIDAAKDFVHVEYFALCRDDETEEIFLALERARRRGVRVRVLLDNIGSRNYPNFDTLQARLTFAGIENHLMLPLKLIGKNSTRLDLRNHRKIVVIDNWHGFTGSQNLIRRNYFRKDEIYYDELVARVEGPVAQQLNAAFITDWYSETGVRLDQNTAPELLRAVEYDKNAGAICQVLPSGSGFENENNLKLFTAAMYAAQRKLVITNPYFVPDDALMTAITSAAQRGVEVTLFNSEASDQFFVSHAQRSYYEQLLKAGVNIYWYKAPILLHSKHITVDDDLAIIGSSNLDMRSFELNMEVTLICYDAGVVRDLRGVEAGYLQKSSLIQLEDWEKRPLKQRLYENISRLTASFQ